MYSQSLTGQWQFRQYKTNQWLPATVPGGVHTDLLALGKISDPFFADNEKKVQWIGEKDWEYHYSFNPAPELLKEKKQFLVCDGLDTLAEVSLNGKLLGKANNMYRQWTWDVSGKLKAGKNEVSLLFRAPVSFIRARQQEQPLIGGGDIPGGPHLRKAPYHWGWDWGPKLPPIGIWKDIRLEGYSIAKFEDVHVRQKHEKGKVILSAEIKIEPWQETSLEVELKITSPDGKVRTVQTEISHREDNSAFIILHSALKNPKLWWPNEYGAQPLYQVEVALRQGKSPLDRRSFQVGLRTLELRREPDQWGESFTFFVNGVLIFAKGANWIPSDSFPTRITDAHLEFLIKSAAGAHMNMLRVWGGGFYEEERFYDLCDRYGILVWQDFTFACGVYPEDEVFAENVRMEALDNVRRLRHRASLALWCGNNEMEQGWFSWGYNEPGNAANQLLKAGYDRMFHHLLPAVVAAEDPDRVYWPSSASSGIPFAEPNGMLRGDMHYWDVWHGRKPFTAYRDQFPRFMSEFGFQSLPPYKTVQAFAAPEDQNMTSYVMEHHQRSGAGNGLIISQMTDTFRMPRDFQSLAYLSMILQAEGIRYGVEHWRRNRERVSGTLIWQLNDCWPVVSWSSVDYFGRWKALHYAARRFYAPLLLSVEDAGTRMAVHITSDLTEAWTGTVHWRLESLDGKLVKSGQEKIKAAPLADTLAASLDFGDNINDENRRNTVFVCELWQGKQRISGCISTFVPSKHLELTDPGLKVDVGLSGETLTFDLSAVSLTRFVELALDGVDAVFSDNYFDLSPNTTVRVTTPLPTGWTLEQAQGALQVRSLVDSF